MTKQLASASPAESAGLPAKLDTRRETLERRLEDGFLRIDEAAISGADVSEWESFWIRLLREYEDVCRELDAAA
jgi:hypothetical protein